MRMVFQLTDLADYLFIFIPEFAQRVAVLGPRLVANLPRPDGNKRTALLCMMEFAARNGCTWDAPEADGPEGDETVEVMVALALAAGDLGPGRVHRLGT